MISNFKKEVLIMKKEISSQIMIPHIMVLDDSHNIKKIGFNDLSYVMLGIMDSLIQEEDSINPETYGLLAANFNNISYTGNDSTILCWHSNIYNITSSLQNGTAKKGDLTKIQERLSEHLIITSLNLSLDIENEEFCQSFEAGVIDVKLGKDEKKRFYRITYELIDSNMEEAFEKGQEYIESNHVPEVRILH